MNGGILAADAQEEHGENARMSSFVGAVAIADLVKTTLGPKGSDKMLVSMQDGGSSITTNDGATILKSIHVDNAAASILIDISKTQDNEVGDGTTTVCVLAGELLREAEKLVAAQIHPQTIIQGWRIATAAARAELERSAVSHKDDPVKFRQDLVDIAMTTLSSKVLNVDKLHFAELAVQAVLRLKGSGNLEAIQVIKKQGGTLRDSFIDEGFLLEKKFGVGQPKRIENAKILVINTAMDTDKIKIFGARVRTDSAATVGAIEVAEREKMKSKVEAMVKTGCNVVVNRQLIYNLAESIFAEHGVAAIEHADFSGIERLALVTGGEIASTFDDPSAAVLGEAEVVEEIMIGEESLIRFSGVKAGEACTIVLRGPSRHLLDEAERSLHDALCVLAKTIDEPRTVWGAGVSELRMARAVDEVATKTEGKRQLAIEAFATALRRLPTIICDNAGLDSSEIVASLRAHHAAGRDTMGIDITTGEPGDISKLAITESFHSKLMAVLSAEEAASMILRVDDIIKAAPRQRQQ